LAEILNDDNKEVALDEMMMMSALY